MKGVEARMEIKMEAKKGSGGKAGASMQEDR